VFARRTQRCIAKVGSSSEISIRERSLEPILLKFSASKWSSVTQVDRAIRLLSYTLLKEVGELSGRTRVTIGNMADMTN